MALWGAALRPRIIGSGEWPPELRYVLVVAGALGSLSALLAAAACGAGIAVMVGRHLQGQAAIHAPREGLARQAPEEVPAVGDHALVAGIDGALCRQHRARRKRGEEARSRLAADEVIVDNLADPTITRDARIRTVRANTAAALRAACDAPAIAARPPPCRMNAQDRPTGVLRLMRTTSPATAPTGCQETVIRPARSCHGRPLASSPDGPARRPAIAGRGIDFDLNRLRMETKAR